MFNFSFGQSQLGTSSSSYAKRPTHFKGHTQELSHQDFMKHLSKKFPNSGITVPTLEECNGVDKWLPSEMSTLERELRQMKQLEGQNLGRNWATPTSSRRPRGVTTTREGTSVVEERPPLDVSPKQPNRKQQDFKRELEEQSLGTAWIAPSSTRRPGSKVGAPVLKKRKLRSDRSK